MKMNVSKASSNIPYLAIIYKILTMQHKSHYSNEFDIRIRKPFFTQSLTKKFKLFWTSYIDKCVKGTQKNTIAK